MRRRMWNHHQRITAPRCHVGRPRSSGVGHFHAVSGSSSIGSRYIHHQHCHCNANSSGAVSQWSGSVQCKCGFRTDQSFRPCHSHCCSFAQPMDARAAYLGAGCVCCNGCSPFQNELMHAGLGLHLLPLAAVSPYLAVYLSTCRRLSAVPGWSVGSRRGVHPAQSPPRHQFFRNLRFFPRPSNCLL